jgi:hypothetical protein
MDVFINVVYWGIIYFDLYITQTGLAVNNELFGQHGIFDDYHLL